jgi:beta-galactosidase
MTSRECGRACVARVLAVLVVAACAGARADDFAVALPSGVKPVWDAGKAFRDATPTRARLCINGLWRWQPAAGPPGPAPKAGWGYLKVPACWPGITDYMQKDCQTVYPHPAWKNERMGGVTSAWYEREVTVPDAWAGRRIVLAVDTINSHASVLVDGRPAGELRFPGGELDLTPLCRPGRTHLLSLLVTALPLKAVLLSYNDTAMARQVRGTVERRGLCGDVFLVGTPPGARVDDVKVDTSVRRSQVACDVALRGLAEGTRYALRARIREQGREVKVVTSPAFSRDDLKNGRTTFAGRWLPERLWDLHTPGNTFTLSLSLLDAAGNVLDTACEFPFGFRELWIDGRDFYLNGTRITLSSVPLDNAAVSALQASYAGAKESLLRLKGIGINMVYTHNYGCEPGSHLGFAEVLRAADDVGMLVSFSQPHFSHYDWKAADADGTNGYARHAEYYVRQAQNHPSVVFYSMSHNATGYENDMNPDMIDGVHDPRDSWSLNNSKLALRAEAIVSRLDPSRIVYHHSSGNLGSMHTSNFYPNFAPIQELSDWFEHWATTGKKPVFTCEYGAPFTWDWAMYRGWYKGERTFGSARIPWEFCLAEWDAQFLGDRAYNISEMEKANLRWEARQLRAGNLWFRWDYPVELGSPRFDDRHTVIGMYTTDNWRAYRTWGVSAISPWEHGHFWTLRAGLDRGRKELPVDWENLQRPGFSADYDGERYERIDLAYPLSDWVPTASGRALLRNNQPLLAYIAGKPARFTSKDHVFRAGETVEKQIIVINNSRVPISCSYSWLMTAPGPGGAVAAEGVGQDNVATGEQARVPVKFTLPAAAPPGSYELRARVRFSPGATQEDAFAIHVLTPAAAPRAIAARVALFDPKGETGALLKSLGVPFESVDATSDLSACDVLVVGKGALTVDGPAPALGRVRDGLKVVVFEQTAAVLEKRLGFRAEEYGLRQVFPRSPGHPALAGLDVDTLRDWRGEATIVPPRLNYELRPRYGPTVRWCDIPVTRVWRCGNRGNVASVLIEKPARGDFLAIVDGGYGLQFSPLMEHREGLGLVVFCQLDVTGRTETDPAAATLAANLLRYAAGWKPRPARNVVYAGEAAGMRYLESAGIAARVYDGSDLSPDTLLVAGPDSAATLAPQAARVADWLKAGGHVLALGLDEREARAFLPIDVHTKTAEHIAQFLGTPGPGSLLAGVGPADVHNRDPRSLPLILGGGDVLGGGVLAEDPGAHVVFCQLVPWQFDARTMNVKRTRRHVSVLVSRLLANLGARASTPVIARFGSPASSSDRRWLDGLYLDQPEEWDDPYRFFRW